MRDLRRYARQTNTRLIAGTLLILFTLGLGLIYVFYGSGGLVSGFVCLLAAFVPILLVVLVLQLMDAVVRRANRE